MSVTYKNVFGFDVGTLAIFALRYAVARGTGGPLAVAEAVRREWKNIHQSDREQIVRELTHDLQRGDCPSEWPALLAWIAAQTSDTWKEAAK